MYLFFDTETTGLPQNWKAPVIDLNKPKANESSDITHLTEIEKIERQYEKGIYTEKENYEKTKEVPQLANALDIKSLQHQKNRIYRL